MMGIEGIGTAGGPGATQPPTGLDDVSGFQDALRQVQQASGADQPMAPPVEEAASLVAPPAIGQLGGERSV